MLNRTLEGTVSRDFLPFFGLKRFYLGPIWIDKTVLRTFSFSRRSLIAKFKNWMSSYFLTTQTCFFSLDMAVFIFLNHWYLTFFCLTIPLKSERSRQNFSISVCVVMVVSTLSTTTVTMCLRSQWLRQHGVHVINGYANIVSAHVHTIFENIKLHFLLHLSLVFSFSKVK